MKSYYVKLTLLRKMKQLLLLVFLLLGTQFVVSPGSNRRKCKGKQESPAKEVYREEFSQVSELYRLLQQKKRALQELENKKVLTNSRICSEQSSFSSIEEEYYRARGNILRKKGDWADGAGSCESPEESISFALRENNAMYITAHDTHLSVVTTNTNLLSHLRRKQETLKRELRTLEETFGRLSPDCLFHLKLCDGGKSGTILTQEFSTLQLFTFEHVMNRIQELACGDTLPPTDILDNIGMHDKIKTAVVSTLNFFSGQNKVNTHLQRHLATLIWALGRGTWFPNVKVTTRVFFFLFLLAKRKKFREDFSVDFGEFFSYVLHVESFTAGSSRKICFGTMTLPSSISRLHPRDWERVDVLLYIVRQIIEGDQGHQDQRGIAAGLLYAMLFAEKAMQLKAPPETIISWLMLVMIGVTILGV